MIERLFRVDERLIHGQVVVGWSRRLGIRRIVVVSDAVASDYDAQEIYRSGLPGSIEALFCSVEDAPVLLGQESVSGPTMVLTEDLSTMARMIERGVEIDEVNVGGIYSGPDREAVLPYVWLDAVDREHIRSIEAATVPVIAQDVPNGARVPLGDRVS